MTKRWNDKLNRLEMWVEPIQQWVPVPDTPSDPTPREQVIRPAMTPSGNVVNTGVGGNVAQAYITPRRQYENIFDDIFGSLIGAGEDLPLGPGMGVKRGGGAKPFPQPRQMFPEISRYAPLYLRRGRY